MLNKLIAVAIVATGALCGWAFTSNPWCAIAGGVLSAGHLYFRTFQSGQTWTKLEAAFNILFTLAFVGTFVATSLLTYQWPWAKVVSQVCMASVMSFVVVGCLAYVVKSRTQ